MRKNQQNKIEKKILLPFGMNTITRYDSDFNNGTMMDMKMSVEAKLK